MVAPSKYIPKMALLSPSLPNTTSRNLAYPRSLVMSYLRYSFISKLNGLVMPNIMSQSFPVSWLSASPFCEGLILLALKASRLIVSNLLSTRLFILILCGLCIIPQFRLSHHSPLNVGTYRTMSRTLGSSSPPTPLGREVSASRCSFYAFLHNLDKGCHIITMVFPDSRDFTTPIYISLIHICMGKLIL